MYGLFNTRAFTVVSVYYVKNKKNVPLTFLALLNRDNPKHKHRNTLCGMFLQYPSLTELPSLEINWALKDVSELGYLFLDRSSLHIIAWDLDVERSQLYFLMLKLEWCQIL